MVESVIVGLVDVLPKGDRGDVGAEMSTELISPMSAFN